MTNIKTFVYIAASLLLLYFISTIKVDNTRPVATIVFDGVQQEPYNPPTSAQQTKKKVEWCKNDKDCTILAEAAYYEARGESDVGVVSVLHTILNRVAHKAWPDSVQGVVYKPKHFSYTHDGSMKQGMNNKIQVERISILAYDVLHGLIESPLVGVTHYHAINVNPYWVHDVEYVAHIGNHIFYRGDR